MAEEIKVNEDEYIVVQITKEVLEVTEEEAVSTLMEIGLFNILNYPLGNTSQKHREIDAILSEGKYPELVKRLKDMFED